MNTFIVITGLFIVFLLSRILNAIDAGWRTLFEDMDKKDKK